MIVCCKLSSEACRSAPDRLPALQLMKGSLSPFLLSETFTPSSPFAIPGPSFSDVMDRNTGRAEEAEEGRRLYLHDFLGWRVWT